jgi:hypothetical protein
VKQIVSKFKIGKTQVYDILKSKSDIKREWLTGNGSMRITKQAEKKDQELEQEEEESPITAPSVKTYSDDLKNLENCSHNSDLIKTISRARMMTENRAYNSISCIKETLFNYWKK